MLRRNQVVALALIGLVGVGASFAQAGRSKSGSVGFPVPRLQKEFRDSLCAQLELARTLEGDRARFLALSLPYGPLDLNMDEAKPQSECHPIKEFSYGYFATAAGLDGAAAQAGLNEYLATFGRLKGKADFTAKLADLKRLSDMVGSVAGLRVISQWGATDYRVNNVQFTEYGFREFKPSPTMGFFTSCEAMTVQNRARVAGLKDIPEAKVTEILALMRKLGVPAVVRQQKWTRVIQAGVSEKEAGLILTAAGQQPPPTTTHLGDGKSVLVLEKVGDGAYYYLTS